MSNAILYFFGINALDLEKINNDYYFKYKNRNFIVYFYERDPNEATEIYYLNLELLNNGFNGYDIFLTREKEVLFLYKDKYYVLMRIPNLKNRTITYNDILSFNYKPVTKIKYLDKSNWGHNWALKIDFIEYQFNELKDKYSLINESINYFIGIWENGISYFNDNYDFSKEKVICHKRVTAGMDLLTFINPFNYVIDYHERNIGDYLKSYAFSNNYSKEDIKKFLNSFDLMTITLIISRLLFPSYYFDIYEDIVLEKKKEGMLEEILYKKNNVLKVLTVIFEIYTSYNIANISWIKKGAN